MNASLGGQWLAKQAELRSVVRTGTALSWKPGTPSNQADACGAPAIVEVWGTSLICQQSDFSQEARNWIVSEIFRHLNVGSQ